MPNELVRSQPCAECGAEMLWTQNAWRAGDEARAAYRCAQGHVIDPASTRQCPNCGVHDTARILAQAGKDGFHCSRCGTAFEVPR